MTQAEIIEIAEIEAWLTSMEVARRSQEREWRDRKARRDHDRRVKEANRRSAKIYAHAWRARGR